jgi:hypothetical protein
MMSGTRRDYLVQIELQVCMQLLGVRPVQCAMLEPIT